MKFSEYMNEWLYAKDGYYAKFREIGKGGDFYTAVSSSIFFGGSIANRLLKVIDEGFLKEDTTIVEIGAHQGYMLADIIQFIYTLRPKLLDTLKFVIVEPQKENIEAQKRYFKDSFGDVVELNHVRSLEEIDLKSAFVVSNELFDAFVCEVIKDDQMLYIDGDRVYFDKQDEKTRSLCKKYDIKRAELGIGYEEFALSLAKGIERFEFVSFDYGDMQKREDYSIRIYHKHKTYPFFALTDFVEDEKERVRDITLSELFKRSDLTYDVNFTHLIGAFAEAGIDLKLFKTQMSMLVEFGITELLDLFAKNSDENSFKSEINRVKVLIDPAFMGERFKGVVFRKS